MYIHLYTHTTKSPCFSWWESQVGYVFAWSPPKLRSLRFCPLQDADCNLIRATRQWWRLGPGNQRWALPNTTWGLFSFLNLTKKSDHLKQIQVFFGMDIVEEPKLEYLWVFPDPETNHKELGAVIITMWKF